MNPIFRPAVAQVFLLWILVLSAPSTQGADIRIWTSTVGSQVEAELISYNQATESVRLRASSGRIIDLKITQLSEADRDFVRKWSSKPATIPAATADSLPHLRLSLPPQRRSSLRLSSIPAGATSLISNGGFELGQAGWIGDGRIVDDPVEPGNPVYEVQLSPHQTKKLALSRPVRVPAEAIQYGAVMRARRSMEYDGESRPLKLAIRAADNESSSYLDRSIYNPGVWQEVKWTRSGDIPKAGLVSFVIYFKAGEGTIWVDDISLYAHPDWKDKANWKPSDG